ncbi:MAG: hypothetical protein QM723_16745 [Myxococcaceae bacterium]
MAKQGDLLGAYLSVAKCVKAAPTFVPGLLEMARLSVLLPPGRVPGHRPGLRERARLLRDAVEASERAAGTVVELAYNVHRLDDDTVKAQPLFEEAAREAERLLVDAWAGLIESLCEQEKFAEARALVARARTVFPASIAIEQAAIWLPKRKKTVR